MIDHGLYISLSEPKVNPSYHCLTTAFLSLMPYFSIDSKTSFSVKPKQSAYCSDVVVTTTRLFKSEKTDSFETLVIPVIIARSIYGLVLKVEFSNPLIKFTNSSQYP